jgi:AraC family transcriptional regulator of adaptative response/methylated-DNA-[protein]-cysteine methyltransferase
MIRTTINNPTILNASKWRAVVRRDGSEDGSFVFAVKTTGVYCRPSCGSKRARRENVEFFDSPDDAERAGYRPCMRCDPRGASIDEKHAALITSACRMIDRAYDTPKLNILAQRVGLSPYHFHRLFKSVTGLTPRAYAMRPARAKTQSFRFAIGECSFGKVLVATSDRGICAIFLGEDRERLVRDLQREFPRVALAQADAEFNDSISQVIRFVDGTDRSLRLPLDIRGTIFQRRVWQALQKIPIGTTISYSELAKRLGAPKAVRAVAGACAANRLAIAIPCHRVVRNDGALSGYRWGVERKRKLLDREARKS